MEALRLQLKELERRWEDDHWQLVRLAAASNSTHVVHRQRELRRSSGSPDECWYCHGRGHIKRDCVTLKRTQRNKAELASIARRHRGKRRGGTLTRRTVVADDVDSARLKQRQSSRESSLEEMKETFALQQASWLLAEHPKAQARLLAEHAKAMLARDRELDTLKETCRDLTLHLKAALDTRAVKSAIYRDKTELENILKVSAKEKSQLGRKQVECDTLNQTLEDGDKKHGLLVSDTDENAQLNSDHQHRLVQLSEVDLLLNCDNEPPRADDDWVKKHQHRLTGRPRRLLGTRNQLAVIKTRRRCLPCLPAREVNIGHFDMSAEVVRDVLVRALDRSRGERSSSTDTPPETINRADIRVCTQDPGTAGSARRRRLPCTPGSSTDVTDSDSSVGTSDRPFLYMVNRSRGERSSSTDTLPETARDETVDGEPVDELSPETVRDATVDDEPVNELWTSQSDGDQLGEVRDAIRIRTPIPLLQEDTKMWLWQEILFSN